MGTSPAGVTFCADCGGVVTLVNVLDGKAPEPRHITEDGQVTACTKK
ncbi:hypothetical protein [Streptomyces sp. MBT55]|nr:hypothetical protein [Streptomyces sp. MBT55]MBK6040817.1 hypothetical protein [Streptomyces sp. MBT55]